MVLKLETCSHSCWMNAGWLWETSSAAHKSTRQRFHLTRDSSHPSLVKGWRLLSGHFWWNKGPCLLSFCAKLTKTPFTESRTFSQQFLQLCLFTQQESLTIRHVGDTEWEVAHGWRCSSSGDTYANSRTKGAQANSSDTSSIPSMKLKH